MNPPIVASFTRRFPMRERTLGNVEQRDATRLPSLPAQLVRQADDRARLSTTLPLAVGDRVMITCVYADGESGWSATVYAAYPERRLVDLSPWMESEQPQAVRVRKVEG